MGEGRTEGRAAAGRRGGHGDCRAGRRARRATGGGRALRRAGWVGRAGRAGRVGRAGMVRMMRGGAGLLALAPLREYGVDLVNEDDGGLLGARDAEERAHELLALAYMGKG